MRTSSAAVVMGARRGGRAMVPAMTRCRTVWIHLPLSIDRRLRWLVLLRWHLLRVVCSWG